jgi:hypothetical protein
MLMTHSVGIVLLQLDGQFVAQVPLLNFQTFASELVKDLIEVSESDTRRWKFYTYRVSTCLFKGSVELWASWLTYRRLRTGFDDVLTALSTSSFIGNVAYEDALMDAWVSWLQDDKPIGNLNVARLRRPNYGYVMCSDRLVDLRRALILHHDAGAVLPEDHECMGLQSPYDDSTSTRIRAMALSYFSCSERKPKDPLQLSDAEFCKGYHAHNKKGLPCYKTQCLPEIA